ncbi:hypothetical protein BDN72DRAFT_434379 [Pluteus cervinus]|uniref:Uncharacterized protein n=1 Tax=Pluteus cervinus TaxID=181527 RepID=A0ACD3B1C4_9AGAR|nr:hypothetical protein BDN72DRAFT_434379 [Pluteus cervinus]
MDTLAPELIEDIFSWIGIECPPKEFARTLVACCLVCNRWKQIAHPLLLSEFPVHGRDYDVPSFIHALLSYPVRSLWIHLDTWSVPTDKRGQLLSNLITNLRTVVIWFRFNAIAPGDARVLSDIFSSDRLTRLGLSGSHRFPVSLFSNCTSLDELYLYKSSLQDLGESPAGQQQEEQKKIRPTLSQLHIETPYYEDIEALHWFSSPQCSFDLSGLARFHCIDLTTDTSTYDIVRTFVNLVSTSLQDLSLCPPPEFGEPIHLDDHHLFSTQFNLLPNLNSLTLSHARLHH